MEETLEFVAFKYGYLKMFAYIQMVSFVIAIFVILSFQDDMLMLISIVLLNILIAYTYLDILVSRKNCENNDDAMNEIAVSWGGLFDSYFVKRIDDDYICDSCNGSFKSYEPKFCPKCGGDVSLKTSNIKKSEKYYGLTLGSFSVIVICGMFYGLELWAVLTQQIGLFLIAFILPFILGISILVDSGIGSFTTGYSENFKMAHIGDGKKMRKIHIKSVECECSRCKNTIFFKNDKYCKNCGRARQK